MKGEPRRAVFLDRDGVLNRVAVRNGIPYPPASLAELQILPDAPNALEALKAAGFLLIGVTNQPDVARGTQRREVVDAINVALLAALPLHEILVCYHDDGDGCDCRKPLPGLLLKAAARYAIDLSTSFIIGDRWKDIETGRRAGCATVFLDYDYGEIGPDSAPDYRVHSLSEAAAWILSHSSRRNQMKSLADLKVKIFADGADKVGMLELYRNPFIKGFTTNPTLMRNARVSDYEAFALEILQAIPDRPISFEVFSDEFGEMERQARKIARWGENVYVKIPVTNTLGESSTKLVHDLAQAGVKLNVTALTALDQVRDASAALAGGPPAIVSMFAGRVADTGRDPVPHMAAAAELVRMYPNVELIWASPRELLNIFHADAVGCHIITVTHDILKKLHLIGKDLHEYSLDTVKMFHNDAMKAGYAL
jgi:transaldolase